MDTHMVKRSAEDLKRRDHLNIITHEGRLRKVQTLRSHHYYMEYLLGPHIML